MKFKSKMGYTYKKHIQKISHPSPRINLKKQQQDFTQIT